LGSAVSSAGEGATRARDEEAPGVDQASIKASAKEAGAGMVGGEGDRELDEEVTEELVEAAAGGGGGAAAREALEEAGGASEGERVCAPLTKPG
jgi:hypothetical protein